ncbi:hypothetical protein JFQ85_000563 [Aeromonas hydrophila]|nr:hypothetical protein [Aeromonas hydrophila]HAT1511213.1 hypothetical protein [Aeromonas hydrophila]HAT1519986.1 hypothetical protein [Aeromonas hydrophila]HAT1523629.1 hypothetical protein [Aeromonas hydrophila]
MIKGLAITPPVIGRICIGKLVQRDNKWVPEKDDSFTLTTQVQQKTGWLLHPLHQHYASSKSAQGHEPAKIRAIPVRVLFNDSDLNLRAEYSAFDRQTGRPLCVGNGEVAKRAGPQGMEEVSCPGPERCPFGQQQGCKLYGRLNLFVEGQGDELGSFIFRTTGYNSVRTLTARLRYFEAVSGGHTRYLLLTLRLRAKSTTQSYRTPVYYVDLTLRDELTLTDAVRQAQEQAARDVEAGLAIEAMETAARQLLRNGQFEEVDEDVPQLLEEFYPQVEDLLPATTQPTASSPDTGSGSGSKAVRVRPAPLTNKLGKANSPASQATP